MINLIIFILSGNQLPTILTGQVITEAMNFPPDIASRMLQQHVDKMLQGQAAIAPITINQPLQVIRQVRHFYINYLLIKFYNILILKGSK